MVISIRNGSGSLQVMRGGSGNRPSMLTLGEGTLGAPESAFAATVFLRNRLGFVGTSMLGAK